MSGYLSKMKYFLVLLLIVKFASPSVALDFKDLGKSAVDATKGIISKIPDAIPSTDDLFQLGKNAIAGYPFQGVNLHVFRNISITFLSHVVNYFSTENVSVFKKIQQKFNVFVLFSNRFSQQSTHSVS